MSNSYISKYGGKFDDGFDPMMIEDDLESNGMECSKCNKKTNFDDIIFLNGCDHTFCKECLISHILECFKYKKPLTCINCKSALLEKEMKVNFLYFYTKK